MSLPPLGRNDTPPNSSKTLTNWLNAVDRLLRGLSAITIASPDATDLASAITLLNEIKAALNGLKG